MKCSRRRYRCKWNAWRSCTPWVKRRNQSRCNERYSPRINDGSRRWHRLSFLRFNHKWAVCKHNPSRGGPAPWLVYSWRCTWAWENDGIYTQLHIFYWSIQRRSKKTHSRRTGFPIKKRDSNNVRSSLSSKIAYTASKFQTTSRITYHSNIPIELHLLILWGFADTAHSLTDLIL